MGWNGKGLEGMRRDGKGWEGMQGDEKGWEVKTKVAPKTLEKWWKIFSDRKYMNPDSP